MTMNSRTVSPEEAAAVAENITLKQRIVELETIIADLMQDYGPPMAAVPVMDTPDGPEIIMPDPESADAN